MRVAFLVVLAFSVAGAGCIAGDAPLAAQSVAALYSDAAPPSTRLSFRAVSWEPVEPESGDDLVVTARVAGVDLKPDYRCNAVVARDGSRGGGLAYGGLLQPSDDGLWRCRIPGGDADAIAFFLAGHDGERWVRSDYFVVPLANGPGAGRPGPDVAGLDLAPVEGKIAAFASVPVSDAFAQDVFLGANVAVQTWYFPASGRGVASTGTLLDEARDGRFEGTVEISPPEDGVGDYSWMREPDAMLVAWAEATNTLDGFAHSPFAELPLGRCASEDCLTT